MNFGNLKATLTRRSRRSPPNSPPDIITANGVADKEESALHLSHLDQDQRHKSVVLKSTKHKPGLWKTLRLKLGSNRQCWDGNESPSDDSDTGFVSPNKQTQQRNKTKSSIVAPASSVVHKQETDLSVSLINGETNSSVKWTIHDEEEASSNNLTFDFYSTVPNNEIRSLTRELFKLSKYGWYWGPITRTEAEEKLSDQPDGAFLVRDSSDDRHLLSLSFRSFGKTLHTRIEHCNGLFSFYAQPEPEGHASIVDLIDDSMSFSQSGVFCYSRARSPGSLSFPVRLTKPVSRFTQVRTLQYLCRFVIRQYTRFDHIQKLPLPSKIRGYIEEGHY